MTAPIPPAFSVYRPDLDEDRSVADLNTFVTFFLLVCEIQQNMATKNGIAGLGE